MAFWLSAVGGEGERGAGMTDIGSQYEAILSTITMPQPHNTVYTLKCFAGTLFTLLKKSDIRNFTGS